jgi:hypothetical protein
MSARASAVLASLLGAVIACVALGQPVQGQGLTSSRDPAVYKSQLQEAVIVGQKTLKALETLSYNDAVPIGTKLLNDAHSTYVLIRVARHGMELQRERAKYPDPVLEVAFKRVDEAWNLARVPIDYRGLPRNQYIPRATGDLRKALRLINQALTILP